MRWMLTDIDARRPVLTNICERDIRYGGRTDPLIYVDSHGSDRCKAESSGQKVVLYLSRGLGA